MKLRSRNHMEAYLLDKYPPYSGATAIKSGVHLPGTAGNYISTPDSVLNSVTGDIDIRACIKPDSWTAGVAQMIVSKEDGSNQRSFYLQLDISTGKLVFVYNDTGLAAGSHTKVSTAAVSFIDGQTGWVRVTFDVDNGAGANTAQFYTSIDGLTWSILGTAVTTAPTGVVQIWDTTAQLMLGARGSSGNVSNFAGTIYYAEVRNGIDGPVVAKFDSSQVAVSGSQLPATIQGWTWNGSALYKRDDYVRLPGTSGNYLSFPDTVANSVTGDIDIRWHGSLDDWTPATTMTLMSKWDSATTRMYRLGIATSGAPFMGISVDGSAQSTATANAGTAYTDGSVGWVRATRTAATGAVLFYTSPDGVVWTQLGTSQSTTAGSLADTTSLLMVGIQDGGTGNPLLGNVYYAEVRNGINGPVVASFNGADNQIQTPWTINGSGWNWEGASFSGKPGVALSLPGAGNGSVSTPDTAGNSVLGNLDIKVKLSLLDWQAGVGQDILSKFGGAGNRSWGLYISAAGKVDLTSSADGTALLFHQSNNPWSYTGSGTHWIRATLTVDNGAAGHTVQFYTSEDGIFWTPFGSKTTAGTTSIFDSTAAISVGGAAVGGSSLVGTVYYAEVRNGIDGPIVAKFDATNIAKTGTRTPTTTVQPGGTPNLLTPNQASIETDASGWVANGNSPTITQDATQFLDGTKSLKMVAVPAGPATMTASTTPVTVAPVVAGKLYTARVNFKAGLTQQTCLVQIDWYTSASAFISTDGGTGVVDATGSWTEGVCTAKAPATAAFGRVTAVVQGAIVAEAHYVDRVSLVEAAEVWTLNGSAWDWIQSAA